MTTRDRAIKRGRRLVKKSAKLGGYTVEAEGVSAYSDAITDLLIAAAHDKRATVALAEDSGDYFAFVIDRCRRDFFAEMGDEGLVEL